MTGKGTVFLVAGSIRYKVTAKFTPGSGGTFNYTGRFTVTGGSGAFKRARSMLSASGTTLPSDPDAATVKLVGTLKY